MHQLQARTASLIQKVGEVNNQRISRCSFYLHPRRAQAALLPLRWELHNLGQLQPVVCSLPDPRLEGMRVNACECLFWHERKGIPIRLGEGIKQERNQNFSACPSQPALSQWLLLPGTAPISAPACQHCSGWASPCPSPSPAAQQLVLRKTNSTNGTGQARGDTSRDSSLISAKPLQSPTAQTQTRLLQSLIKLKKLWPEPYGNGNMPTLAQSLSSHIGFQVPLSKYGSIRSFQRKDFLNYSNTEKNNVFFPGSCRPLKYWLIFFFFLKKTLKRQSHDIRTGSCT